MGRHRSSTDTPYEGKRTSAIRKFKEWKDAEYKVRGVSVATMRLPMNGRFEEREALASIQIEHKSTKVSVGSDSRRSNGSNLPRIPNRLSARW